MPKSRLNELLQALHGELQHPGALDDESRQLLQALGQDIERKLGGDSDETLTERVTDAIERFEGRHPELTALLNRIADTLSSLGI